MGTSSEELCFVLMPFENSRRGHETNAVDFDKRYCRLIAPAVRAAGLRPIRADQALLGGVFHKTMFERLATCRFAIVGVSLSSPNLFYESGI